MKNDNKIFLLILVYLSTNLYAQEMITDIDGNTYGTVKIGEQVWMNENLRTTKYANGDTISTTCPITLDISDEITPKYQWTYNGDENYAKEYGRLYTWYTVTDSRKICPLGWHVPTMKEWKTLFEYLGGGNIAANKLKEEGEIHWEAPNKGANNESGFTALPAGSRWLYGKFTQLGKFGHYWAFDEQYPGYAGRILLRFDDDTSKQIGSSDPKNGWPVRCLKD